VYVLFEYFLAETAFGKMSRLLWLDVDIVTVNDGSVACIGC